MKRIKKLAALMLAAIMALAMSVTAFAAETELTVQSGTYSIYQIFTGDYSDGTLSNVKWGKNAKLSDGVKIGDKVSETVLKELEAQYKTEDTAENNYTVDDVAQLAVIQKYADLTNPIETGTQTSYSGLEPGYYLVSGTVTYSDNTSSADTLYVVRVIDGTLTFQPKVGVPTVDKKIVDGTEVDTNEASIGDDVNYKITGTMPSNIDVYKEYTYVFTDTLSKGLTYKENSIQVTVNDKDVTEYFWKSVEKVQDGPTSIEVSIKDLKALSLLTDLAVGPITSTTEVVLTYTATLNTDAVIAGAGNPNDVVLQYSNDPNNSGEGATNPPSDTPEKPIHPEGTTPKKEVVTYTTELAILKTDEAGEILEDAEFTLTGSGVKVSLVTNEEFVSAEDGAYWKLKNGSYTTIAPVTEPGDKNNEADYDLTAGKFNLVRTITTEKDPTKAVAIIGEDGRVTFTGLGAGEYTITETKTPAGYNTIEPITFTVTFNATDKKFSADKVSLGVNNTLETTIVNQKGSLLPSTGGIGTTIFYIVGAVLVIGAGIILVTKKRMSREV